MSYNPRVSVAVAAAKSSAFINAWKPDDIEVPTKGLKKHFDDLTSLDRLWAMSTMMSAIDTGPKMDEIYNAHRAWGRAVAEMYAYLLEHSANRLPSSLHACGEQLILSREEMNQDHLEPELVTKLKDRAIALTMDITLGEFSLLSSEEDAKEKEAARRALEALQALYCSTDAEEEWKAKEVARLTLVVSEDQNREDFPRLYLEQLDLYTKYLMEVEKHLAASL